uniref:Uncharacterized protein n=1 Tax=Myoviridae sp. ctFPV8 TaxID=2825068 RepID=A0A8S5PD33_9CAUD|nr:MAG TPA: hypothetical protein [Myoviridae sp. ctFPV8]
MLIKASLRPVTMLLEYLYYEHNRRPLELE